MVDLLELQKHFILQHLGEGDIASDFTMGNGNDTLFLSKTVGASGKVFAFDLQESALSSTRMRLQNEGAPENYTLICASHHRLKEYINEPIKAGMFNLGYLPGGVEKGVTTKCETTLPAVRDAIDILAPDGVLLIAVYPGHDEGRAEGEMLASYFATLNRYQYCSSVFRILNSSSAPYFYIIEKRNAVPVKHPGRAAKNAKRAERLAEQINTATKKLEEKTGQDSEAMN